MPRSPAWYVDGVALPRPIPLQLGDDWKAVAAKSAPIGGISSIDIHIDTAFHEPLPVTPDHVTLHAGQQWRKSKHEDSCKCCAEKGVQSALTMQRGIELGHTFYLGQKYSAPFNVAVAGADGKPVTVEMGCYGLGVTRILAAIVDTHRDEFAGRMSGCDSHGHRRGIRWPLRVAPYKICIVALSTGALATDATSVDMCAADHAAEAARLHDALSAAPGLQGGVVLDGRSVPLIDATCITRCSDRSLGSKLVDARLLGYPFIVVVGNKFQCWGNDDRLPQ